MNLLKLLLCFSTCVYPLVAWAQFPSSVSVPDTTPSSPGPDTRFKADILVVVAHPDDETAITGYLAKAIYEQHKSVAVLFGTRGNSGGNQVGYEQAQSLADVREIEARKALASIGVMNVWFMHGTDTPSENVLYSLETWGHGTALEEAVRVVRLTRPEVILTWLPDSVVGENHGDHQASAVIATEAFDMAGDPTAFPEQVAYPADRTGFSNLTEGLRPWQPQKLYFFSDASQIEFMKGQGPAYSVIGTSPVLHIPYDRWIAVEEAYHLTQGDTGQAATDAIKTGNFKDFQEPVRFIFGKSLVGGSTVGDIFDGVVPGPIPFVPVPGYRTQPRAGLSIELGGQWKFYREFWAAHHLNHLADLMKIPELGVDPGGTVTIPLLLRNDTGKVQMIQLTADVPVDWKERDIPSQYPVAAHDVYPVQVVLTTPKQPTRHWQQFKWQARSGNQILGEVTMKAWVKVPSTVQIH